MAASAKKALEVIVSKVPWSVANKEMREYFGQFGHVNKCVLLFDKETGFHKGFCWIRFSSEEGLTNALQKNPHILEGTKLHVQRNIQPFSGPKSFRDGDLFD